MSIRSEIRAALFDGPKTTDELLPLVPSVEGDRVKLSANMSTLSGSQMVRAMLPELCCLRLTKDGHPEHPLYLPRELRPVALGPNTQVSGAGQASASAPGWTPK